MDFTKRQIKLQNLASQISKYTFSLAIYQGSKIDYLTPYGVKKYGYLYLNEFENIYSYKDGLDTSVLSGDNIPLIIQEKDMNKITGTLINYYFNETKKHIAKIESVKRALDNIMPLNIESFDKLSIL